MGIRFWNVANKIKLFFKLPNVFQRLISLSLVFLLTVESSIAFGKASVQGLQTVSPTSPTNAFRSHIGSEANPFWDEFINTKTEKWEHRFDLSEPSLDQDPFFLKSQTWSQRDLPAGVQRPKDLYGAVGFQQNGQALDLFVGNTRQALRIHLPLIPLNATDEYAFFSLSKQLSLFQKAAGNQAGGEGLFFISLKELRQAASSKFSVPLYYLPIAGTGWTGKLESLVIPQAGIMVVSNGKEAIPFEIADITTIMKAQQINLMLATAFTVQNRGMNKTGPTLPMAGTTAAFGMVFTGLDLQQPENSFWSPKGKSSARTELQNLIFKVVQKSIIAQSVLSAINFMLPSAYAVEISDAAMNRITYVGSGLIFMLGISMIIKYKHPAIRRKLEARYPIEAEKAQKFFSSDFNRENRMLFDIFAAVTTTAAQIPSVTTAQATEMFLDRFAPTVTAADHTIARRILNNTFYYSRNQMRNVPVNSKTFVMGAIVLNGVDTGSLGIQYEVAVPMISNGLAKFGDDEFKRLVDDTFSMGNQDSAKIIVEDTVRNGLAYGLNGAASQSNEAKGIYEDGVTREVEADMIKQGLDPRSIENKEKKEKEIALRLGRILEQQGLPSDKDFLFDFNTVVDQLPNMLGYTSTAIERRGSFLLARRYMLAGNALDKSIALAQEWARTDYSGLAKQALAILEETKSQMNFLQNIQKYGKRDGIIFARSARRQLTLLSYQGPVDMIVRYMPKVWRDNYPAEAANIAGVFFRQALYSYISAEGDAMLFPTEERMGKFKDAATNLALSQMKDKDSTVTTPEKLTPSQKLEFKMRFQMAVNNLARVEAANTAAQQFTGPEMDWLAKRKHNRALEIADNQMADFNKTEAAATLTPDQLFLKKMQFYRDALAKQVGIHIEDVDAAKASGRDNYVRLMELAETQALSKTESEIDKDLNMKTYYGKLNAVEQAKLKMYLYANNFFQAYKTGASEIEMVGPTDPAQLGRFQWLRQREIVRNSTVLTRLVRIAESPFNDKALTASAMHSLARTFPLGYDLVTTHIQMFKRYPILMTSSYLFNFYAWQMHLPYGAWIVMMLASAATISTPSAWLMRASRMQGLKPKANALSQVAYGLPYTWVTFTGMIPLMLYSPKVQTFFNDYLRDPVMHALSGVPMSIWLSGLVASVVAWKLGREKVGQAVNEKSSAVTKLVPDHAGAGLRCEGLF